MRKVNCKVTYVLAAIIVCMAFIFTSFAAGGGVAVYAATSAKDSVQALYEKQNIIDDLKKSEIDGEPFDFSKWNFDESKNTQVLSFVEFCFSFYASKRGDFGLYIYVYNPKGLTYAYDSSLNSISMAFAPVFDDETVEYLPYRIEYLNMSTTAGYEGLFLKYKVVLSDADKQGIFSVMNSTERVYKVGELQLLIDGDFNPTAYSVSNTYTYSGYSKGYGSSAATESTLTCSTLGLTSISPKVHHTFYRPSGSNGKNSYTQDTLYSVYFSVPNELLETYGELVEIRATWLKTMLQWAFVTGDQEFYDFAMKYRGYDMSKLYYVMGAGKQGGYGTPPKPESYEGWAKSTLGGSYSDLFSNRIYAQDYNGYGVFDYGFSNIGGTFDGNCGWFSGIYWAGDYLDSADKYVVPSEDILATMQSYYSDYNDRSVFEYVKHIKSGNLYFLNTYYTYPKYYGEYLEVDGITYPYSKALFESWDKKVTVADVPSTKEYKLTSQKINKSFWEKIFGGSHVEYSTTFDGIKAIQYVDKDDIKSTAKATADHLYIDANDFDNFKAFYDTATAANETVILFRFDMGEYSAVETLLGTTNNSTLVTPNMNIKSTNGRIFKQNVYLGFDIIHLKFEGEKGTTIIPVVMSPMTITADSTPALHTTSDSNDWWKIMLGVLLLIVLLVLLMPVIPYIFKFIAWVVTAPFKALSNLTKRRTDKPEPKEKKELKRQQNEERERPPSIEQLTEQTTTTESNVTDR